MAYPWPAFMDGNPHTSFLMGWMTGSVSAATVAMFGHLSGERCERKRREKAAHEVNLAIRSGCVQRCSHGIVIDELYQQPASKETPPSLPD